MSRVLVTGASGYVASYLLPAFRERYDLRLVDSRAEDGLGERIEGIELLDLSDLDKMEECREVFQNIDTVVHLANVPSASAGLQDRYLAERSNIDMAYLVYQLALDEGVRRVVVASSNHATDFYERALRDGLVDIIQPDGIALRPLADNFYGWAKECYEHLGFVYASGVSATPTVGAAETSLRPRQLEVIQIRIGGPRDLRATSFSDERRNDAWTLHRDLGMWTSPRDLTQLFVKSIDTQEIRNDLGIPFQVFYGMSANTRSSWSLANARQVVGYEPQDDSEIVYADDIRKWLTGPVIEGLEAVDLGGKGSR